jgi:hypothetical protein
MIDLIIYIRIQYLYYDMFIFITCFIVFSFYTRTIVIELANYVLFRKAMLTEITSLM